MTALAADKVRDVVGFAGYKGYIGAAASAAWYNGSIIVRDASGYGAVGTDTSGVEVVGVADLKGNNTGGANGAVDIGYRFGHVEGFAGSGLSITDVGFDVVVSDDQTVKRADAQESYDLGPFPKALDGAANTTTAEAAIGVVQRKTKLLAAYYVPGAGLTGHDTDYATITISKRTSAGASKTTIAQQTTKLTGGSGSWTAFAPVPITLTSTAADLFIAAGSSITYEIAKAGSGVAVVAGVFVFVFGPAQPVVGRLVAYRSSTAYVRVGGFRGALAA